MFILLRDAIYYLCNLSIEDINNFGITPELYFGDPRNIPNKLACEFATNIGGIEYDEINRVFTKPIGSYSDDFRIKTKHEINYSNGSLKKMINESNS